jgi:hypothetical protein
MVQSVQKKLFQHIDDHLSSYLGEWKDLAASATRSDPSNNILMLYVQQHGVETQVWGAEPPLLYAQRQTGAPRTLLLYHDYPARSSDVAAFLAITTAAIDAYQQAIGPLPVNIKWLFVGEESRDLAQLTSIIEQHKADLQANGCLFPVQEWVGLSEPVLALGTKGQLCVEMEAETAPHPSPSQHGGIVPNAAWRLLWALSSLKSAQEEILIEGFYDTLISLEEDAIAPLYSLPDSTPSLCQRWGLQQLLFGLSGFQLYYSWLLTPTCTINDISSGTQGDELSGLHNMVPARARAQMDFHLVPGQDPQDLFTKLQRHLQTRGFPDIQVRLLYSRPPAYTQLVDPFVEHVRRASASAYGHTPIILPLIPSSYPIASLQCITGLPIVLCVESNAFSEWDMTDPARRAQDFATRIKQVAMLLENMKEG